MWLVGFETWYALRERDGANSELAEDFIWHNGAVGTDVDFLNKLISNV